MIYNLHLLQIVRSFFLYDLLSRAIYIGFSNQFPCVDVLIVGFPCSRFDVTDKKLNLVFLHCSLCICLYYDLPDYIICFLIFRHQTYCMLTNLLEPALVIALINEIFATMNRVWVMIYMTSYRFVPFLALNCMWSCSDMPSSKWC